MLIQPTLDTLNRMKLHGMALALAEQTTTNAAHGLAFEERLALLLEREEITRDNRRMTRLLQLATLNTETPSSRTSITGRAPVLTARNSRASPPASGSARTKAC